MASDARQRYYKTGEVVLVDGIPSIEKAKTMNEFWGRAADYYRNPKRVGSAEKYAPMRAAMSLDTRYAFNPSEKMELIGGFSFLAIVGSQALSVYFSEIAVENGLKAWIYAELFKIEGAHYFDLYDQEKYVEQAVIKLDDFFTSKFK